MSVPQSPVYLTCVSSQPLTPLSLPAGVDPSSLYFYQTASPHLTPLRLSPKSASANVSGAPAFTFSTGRRASTGSLAEPMQCVQPQPAAVSQPLYAHSPLQLHPLVARHGAARSGAARSRGSSQPCPGRR